MDSGMANVRVCNVRRSSVDICAKFMTQHFSIILILLDAKAARIKRRKIVVWLVRTATGHGKPKRTKFRSRPTRLSTGLHAHNVISIFSKSIRHKLLVALRFSNCSSKGFAVRLTTAHNASYCQLADETNWFDQTHSANPFLSLSINLSFW